jgi:hypothetical protein
VEKWRRMIREDLAGHMGQTRNAYRIVVGNPEGKRPLRILTCVCGRY